MSSCTRLVQPANCPNSLSSATMRSDICLHTYVPRYRHIPLPHPIALIITISASSHIVASHSPRFVRLVRVLEKLYDVYCLTLRVPLVASRCRCSRCRRLCCSLRPCIVADICTDHCTAIELTPSNGTECRFAFIRMNKLHIHTPNAFRLHP